MAHPRILILSGYNQLPGNAVLPRDTAPQYNQLPGMYWEEAPRILLLSTTSYQECTGKKHPGYCSSVQPATRNVLGRSTQDTAPQYNQLPGMYWEEAPDLYNNLVCYAAGYVCGAAAVHSLLMKRRQSYAGRSCPYTTCCCQGFRTTLSSP